MAWNCGLRPYLLQKAYADSNEGKQYMKLWHKLIVTVIAMLVASFAGGRLWFMAFDFVMPSYLAGMVGGLAAIPVWERLRRIGNKTP